MGFILLGENCVLYDANHVLLSFKLLAKRCVVTHYLCNYLLSQRVHSLKTVLLNNVC